MSPFVTVTKLKEAVVFFIAAPIRVGFLGSIDSNTGSPDLGWDTDQFPMDIKNCTLVMKVSDSLFYNYLMMMMIRLFITLAAYG